MLADKIRALCEKRGVTISSVESSCNLSIGAISKWNRSSPKVINLKAVADYFEMTVDELLREEETDAPRES